MSQGLAGVAGRHVRRQRGGVRRRTGHARRDPDEKLVENAADRGAPAAGGPAAGRRTARAISDVRGLGLMLGNEFRDGDGAPDGATAARAQQEAAKNGLLLLTCGAYGQVVRFIPALVVTEAQVDEAAGIWADSVAAVV